jgi:NitT/TauT family transport system ATP-binding protein
MADAVGPGESGAAMNAKVLSQDSGSASTNAVPAGRLVCRDVRKTFVRKGTPLLAIDNASLTVEPGEFVALVGPSGCGKSTLLRLIDGLSKVDGGEIEVGGKRVTRPGPDRAFVFQSDSLLPWRSVEANVAVGLELRRVPRREARAEVARLLEMVGLSDFAERYPHELSGGMRQRVNMIRALAVDPAVLLMDEPFSALDAQTRELMQAEVTRLWSASRKTVLFVTHSIEEAVFLADRVLVMSSRPGRIKKEFPIPLPRPREVGIQRTPEFSEIARAIWEELRSDVLRSFAIETNNEQMLAELNAEIDREAEGSGDRG